MDSTTASMCAEAPITLVVGSDLQKRYVHNALLVHHSEYFRKALNGPWKEAEERVVRLEDVDLAAVDVFTHWLYTGQVPGPEGDKEWNRVSGEVSETEFNVKIRAYAFADRFIVSELQRVLHNSLVAAIELEHIYPETLFTEPEIRQAFAIMRPNTLPLQLLVDRHCDTWTNCCDDPGRDMSDFPPSFLARCMRRLSELYQDEKCPQASGNRCYYEHADRAEKTACEKLHMHFDVERGTGFFGKTIWCEICRRTAAAGFMVGPPTSDSELTPDASEGESE